MTEMNHAGGGPMNTIVEMKKLNKSYGSHHVLKDIDLSVSRGEVVVVIGASGSGKSTLIRCVNGLEMYQNGSLMVDGYHMPVEEDRLLGGEKELAAIRKGVGMVFQQFNLFPHMTVLENITIAPMRVRKESKEEAEATASSSWNASASKAQHKYPGAALGRPAAARRNRPVARAWGRSSCSSTSRPPRSIRR